MTPCRENLERKFHEKEKMQRFVFAEFMKTCDVLVIGLNNSLWKKQTIKVQQAQESFLDRLQKEREQAAKPKAVEKLPDQSTLYSQQIGSAL